MYKCRECGNIFDYGDESVWSEDRGFIGDERVYEVMGGCPCCGGSYDETVRCKKCGSEHLEDELFDGVCEDCLVDIKSTYKYNIKKCFELADKSGEKNNVGINPFLFCMFTERQIEEVLYRELIYASSVKPIDCTPFIESDEYWFNERIVEEVKK